MKKFYFLMTMIFVAYNAGAQIINFSDTNFKNRLLQSSPANSIAKDISGNNIRIDANSNGQIEISEALLVDALYLDSPSASILSLDGINNFTNLTSLSCGGFHLTSINISLPNLRNLYCPTNNMTTLSLVNLPALTSLTCSYNLLTSINFGATNLVQLNCESNQLTSLNLSNMTNLRDFTCRYNQLSALNFTGIHGIESLYCDHNLITTLDFASQYILRFVNADYNLLTSIDLSSNLNMQSLNCMNNQISSIVLGTSPTLQGLYCSNNLLTSLNLNTCSTLRRLYCSYNQLTSINVNNQEYLLQLYCDHNQISTVDVRGLNQLDRLYCQSNQLTSLYFNNDSTETELDFSGNPNLAYICTDALQQVQVQSLITNYGYTGCTLSTNCSPSNSIVSIPDAAFKAKLLAASPANNTAVDFSGNPMTVDTNHDSEIQLTEALLVKSLNVNATAIHYLTGIKSFENLTKLDCAGNLIQELDVSGLVFLQQLDFWQSNDMIALTAENCTALQSLDFSLESTIGNVDLKGCTSLAPFDLASIPNIRYLTLSGCQTAPIMDLSANTQLNYLDVSNCVSITSLLADNLHLYSLDISGCSNLTVLHCGHNQLTELDLTGHTNLTDIECQNNQISSLNTTGLIHLMRLDCSVNPIATLNTSDLSALMNLNVHNCQLTALNTLELTNVTILRCGLNQIANLNLQNMTNLTSLSCDSNQLTTLNLNGLTNLQDFTCNSNQIQTLDLSALENLEFVDCGFNQLNDLTLPTSGNLAYLRCNNNNLANLSATAVASDFELICDSNQLTSLNIKNGVTDQVSIFDNSNLEYICVDDNELPAILTMLADLGMVNCVANSYCSFIPGGTVYNIQGNNRLDVSGNGCDASDPFYPSLKFNLTDGTSTGSSISNTSGSYSIALPEGTHTITPVLENLAYFSVSPATVNVVFPTDATPYLQDFCIAPNGTHPDVEVIMLPLDQARPGFDANYKIIYKNKGTNAQSGLINFGFNDAVLDFVTSSPLPSGQIINYRSWNFTNLLPFETREILLTLNVNSPLETPPVNSGFILEYTLAINAVAIDETPQDNTFVLSQIVVNSLDPNDKTCLEGAVITPEMVGKEVHYMIRFENSGTANAQNIVVKDIIDTNKFDISSLIPLDASHSFVTKISNGNQVEFIFEDINLPFDDANNDGYVAFKIKTKPTLILGDSFNNTASIYFDYNAPIVTNTASTTIGVLAAPDFEFENYFRIYPNPANAVLNIDSKMKIEVTSICIYNTLGQLMLVIPNAQQVKTIDVSGLKTGNYLMKINSDKGSSNTKFIKM